MAKKRRKVLVHRIHGTVHALRRDGTTWCGNGLGFTRPGQQRWWKHATPAVDYDIMWSDRLPLHAHHCERCTWILGNRHLKAVA